MISAPVMVVISPENEVKYIGGYTSRKKGNDISDQEIIDELIKKREVKNIPVFGCASSKELQKSLDPFGVKYSLPNWLKLDF